MAATKQAQAMRLSWDRANKLAKLTGKEPRDCRSFLSGMNGEAAILDKQGVDGRNKGVKKLIKGMSTWVRPPKKKATKKRTYTKRTPATPTESRVNMGQALQDVRSAQLKNDMTFEETVEMAYVLSVLSEKPLDLAKMDKQLKTKYKE